MSELKRMGSKRKMDEKVYNELKVKIRLIAVV